MEYEKALKMFRDVITQYITITYVNEVTIKEINAMFINEDLGMKDERIERDIEHIRRVTLKRYKMMFEKIVGKKLNFKEETYEKIKDEIEKLITQSLEKQDENQTKVEDF